MNFSAFARLAGGFAFSSRPPHGQSIYEDLKSGFGDTYETSFDGIQQARLYAQAMCLGAAQYQIDRALNNRKAATATELLPSIERDYQIIPAYNATLDDRRSVAAAHALVTRGSRREAVEDALRSLLGADFVSYSPTDTGSLVSWPPSPGAIGVFDRAGAQKKLFSINTVVSMTGVPVTVSFTSLGGTDAPLRGETYTVGPDSRDPSTEQITVSSVSGSTLTTTFSKPHVLGTLGVRPHPVFVSSKRYARIVVSATAAANPETRRKINEQMKRQLRGVSRWTIVSDQGGFILNSPTSGILDATQLG